MSLRLLGSGLESSVSFNWTAAETGLRGDELAGLKLTDIDGEKLTINRSVWHCKEKTPKTNNALRTLALSQQFISLLWEQIARQKRRGHEYLFSWPARCFVPVKS